MPLVKARCDNDNMELRKPKSQETLEPLVVSPGITGIIVVSPLICRRPPAAKTKKGFFTADSQERNA